MYFSQQNRIFAVNQNNRNMAQFINPFSDWGFKHIFGREISKDLLTVERFKRGDIRYLLHNGRGQRDYRGNAKPRTRTLH